MEAPENYDIPALRSRLTALLGSDAGIYPVHLEQQFPRILEKIVALWGQSSLDGFLADLMVTTRSGRQGFPPEVLTEIFKLSNAHAALGLTPDKSIGTGWNWIDDPELFKREFGKEGGE